MRSRIFGNLLVSLPFFSYGGLCAETPEAEAALLDAAIALAKRTGATSLELRHEADLLTDLSKKTTKVSMRLELPTCADALWRGFPAKLRSQIQRPRKAGMTPVIGRDEHLDEFYDIFSRKMRELGTPVYPKAFFANILQRFPEQTRIAAVYKGELPVAAGFLTGFKHRLEIPWAASLREFNRSSPNMLLYWTCLDFACKAGFRVFDFGRCTPGGGTFRFKRQWGALPHQLFWHYWVQDGQPVPQLNPQNPRYRTAIALWQRLPLDVTRMLGPMIVKYIP